MIENMVIDTENAIWRTRDYLSDILLYSGMHTSRTVGNTSDMISDGKSFIIQHTVATAPVWLWTKDGISSAEIELLRKCFAEYVGDGDILYNAKADISDILNIDLWARGYKAAYREPFIAYIMNRLIMPEKSGNVRKMTADDFDAVSLMIGKFRHDCFGIRAPKSETDENTRIMLENKYTIIIEADGQPAGCATATNGMFAGYYRINNVYISDEYRGRGLASYMVASLCKNLFADGMIPILYADGTNPISNRVYKNIGFEQNGVLYETKMNKKKES